MGWQVIIFWDTSDSHHQGWKWRVVNLQLGVDERGSAESVEQARSFMEDILDRWNVSREAVSIEIWDEGVWDKC